MHDNWPLIVAVAGVGLLLLLVLWQRWSPFVALIFCALAMGLAAGMTPPAKIVDSIGNGIAEGAESVAIIIVLGAVFGQLLSASGGAEQLARSLLRLFGPRFAHWAMAMAGILVSIPVFFEVGLIILLPMVISLGKATGRSPLFYGIPLMAGLAVSHAFIPTHPGPVVAASLLRVEFGWVILLGLIAGFPAALVAGPIWGSFIAPRVKQDAAAFVAPQDSDSSVSAADFPSSLHVLSLIGLPLVLILGKTVAAALPAGIMRHTLEFFGDPRVALLLMTMLSFQTLGRRFSRESLSVLAARGLEVAGPIVLVVCAGGAFKQVLIDSGVGIIIKQQMQHTHVSPVVFAFALASLLRIAQGSATVAMQTTAGMVAAVFDLHHMDQPHLALITIATAAGGTICSHVNDAGFWLVNRSYGMSVKDTLKSWTVMETLIALVAFAMTLMMSLAF